MFGDVGKFGGYKENPSPIFSGFWGHIHHWDGHSAIAFVVALHSNWEAGDVHIHHSDIIVSELLQQTKPNQLKLIIRMTGLSNVWIFQKNKYKLNHISLSLSLCLLNLHRKSSTENFPWKSNLMRNYPRLMHCHGALDRTTTFQCIRRQRFFALRHLGGTFITMKTGSFHIPAIQALGGLKPQILWNCHEFLTKSWGRLNERSHGPWKRKKNMPKPKNRPRYTSYPSFETLLVQVKGKHPKII